MDVPWHDASISSDASDKTCCAVILCDVCEWFVLLILCKVMANVLKKEILFVNKHNFPYLCKRIL